MALKRRRVKLGASLVMVSMAVVVLTMAFVSQYTGYVLGLVVVEAIAILSLNLLMGYAGQVSLGQAAFVGIGAFTAAQLAQSNVPFPLPIILAGLFAALVAAGVGLPSLRIRGLQVAATTLAFGAVAQYFLFKRPWTSNAGTSVQVTRPNLIATDKAVLLMGLIGLVVILIIDRQIRHSRIGRTFVCEVTAGTDHEAFDTAEDAIAAAVTDAGCPIDVDWDSREQVYATPGDIDLHALDNNALDGGPEPA